MIIETERDFIAQYAFGKELVRDRCIIGEPLSRSIGVRIQSAILDIYADLTFPNAMNPHENNFEFQLRYSNARKGFEALGRVRFNKGNIDDSSVCIKTPLAIDSVKSTYKICGDISAISAQRFAPQLSAVVQGLLDTTDSDLAEVRDGLRKVNYQDISESRFPSIRSTRGDKITDSYKESKERLAPFGKDIISYFISD